MRSATVIVPAHNEEHNIGSLLHRILAESVACGWLLDDVIVVASGCTDATVERAMAFVEQHNPVRVLVQEQREGKASAINMGLAAARHDLIVLISSDVLPVPGAISALLDGLDDESVGVVGCHPIPLNDDSTFPGFATHLLWRLHHRISETSVDPKCGEMIAFRRTAGGELLVPAIPVDSAVDEVSIQAIIATAGLRSAYAPQAIVRNWGPSSLRDWFRQRRRINAGHILSARQGYSPITMHGSVILRFALRDREALRHPGRLATVALLEVAARALGRLDVARGRSHAVWQVAQSTKRPIPQETT